MLRKRFPIDQIITKLCEAEVCILRGETVARPVRASKASSSFTTAGANSTAYRSRARSNEWRSPQRRADDSAKPLARGAA